MVLFRAKHRLILRAVVGFILALTSPASAVLAQSLPTVSLVASDGTAAEAGSTGEFTLALDVPAGPNGLTVPLQFSGSAIADVDYDALPNTIVFAPNSRSATLVVRPRKDDLVEGLETVVATIQPNASYNISGNASATVAILDSQASGGPVISIRATDAEASETGNNTGAVVVELNSPAGPEGLSVNLQIAGTATRGLDYADVPNTVSISPGSTQATVTITPLDDTLVEGDETVILNLAPAAGYSIASAASIALIVIHDNEAPNNNGGAPGNTNSPIASIAIATQSTAALGKDTLLTARVLDANQQPVAAVATTWHLSAASQNAGGQLSAMDSNTNADGHAHATLTTGAQPASYVVTFTANGVDSSGAAIALSADFVVDAGLIHSVGWSTPEGSIARVLDQLCTQLQGPEAHPSTQLALLDRCTALLDAERSGDDAAVARALRAIAPEEVAIEQHTAASFVGQQLQNIAARLAALRRGMRGFDASGFRAETSSGTVPGWALSSWLPRNATGGSAGAIGDDSDADRMPASEHVQNTEPTWLSERVGIFVTGDLGRGNKSITDAEAGFDFSTRGVTGGFDYRLSDQAVVGVALGLANTNVTISDDGGDLRAKGFSLSTYASYYFTAASYVDAVLSFGSHNFDATRQIDYQLPTESIQRTANSNTGGNTLALSLGISHEWLLQKILTAEVFARGDYQTSTIDAYSENGADEFDLTIGEQKNNAWSTFVGGDISSSISRSFGVIVPQLRFGWQHDGSDTATIAGYFANDPARTPFQFNSDTPDRDFFRLALGVSAQLPRGIALFTNVETVLGKQNYRQSDWSVGARYARAF